MTEVTVHGDGFAIDSPEIAAALDDELVRARFFRDLDDTGDSHRLPPVASPAMFHGVLGELVSLCCEHSEAVPVAVATYALAFFSAHLGPLRYLAIGDERRRLNNYWLLIGPTGMGKGASEYGVRRIFGRVEETLQEHFFDAMNRGQTDGITVFPSLDIHDGGLSSGEGLATAKADCLKLEKGEPPVEVTDKRFLLLESEFGNVLNMAERSGNTLSHALRNGYDSKTIRPLTKRDRVCCTDPYFVLVGNITPGELAGHRQNAVMSVNGMLNRTLMLWTRTGSRHARPLPMDDGTVSEIARRLAGHLLRARNFTFETHWRRQAALSTPVQLDSAAWQLWDDAYPELVNLKDCEPVQTLCRRHRLHILITAALLALVNGQDVVDAPSLRAAMAWSDYGRQSVVYACRYFELQARSQRQQRIGHGILQAVSACESDCSMKAVYGWFGNRIRAEELHDGLEWCLNFIPPLLVIDRMTGRRGRPSSCLRLTAEGHRVLQGTPS